MNKIFNKEKTSYVLLLLSLIIIAEIVVYVFQIPSWPMFCCMVFFILGEKDTKKIKDIMVGSLFGILTVLLLHGAIGIAEPIFGGAGIGEFLIKIIIVCIFVACIAFFHEILPYIFNDYAFMFFIIGNVAKVYENPLTILLIDLIGGGFMIAGVFAIKTLLNKKKMPKPEIGDDTEE